MADASNIPSSPLDKEPDGWTRDEWTALVAHAYRTLGFQAFVQLKTVRAGSARIREEGVQGAGSEALRAIAAAADSIVV